MRYKAFVLVYRVVVLRIPTVFIRYPVVLQIVKRICVAEFKSTICANKKGRWDVGAILYIYVCSRMFREKDEGIVFGSGNCWLCI